MTVNLVNKDQLDILASLRESVNEDKNVLESQLRKLQSQLQDEKEKNKKHLEHINDLLREKVDLQSEGIGQREKMLERERNLTFVFVLPSNISTIHLYPEIFERHFLGKTCPRRRKRGYSVCMRTAHSRSKYARRTRSY